MIGFRMRLLSLSLVAAAIFGCTAPSKVVRPRVSADRGATAVDYDLWIDSDVERAVVEVCAEGNVAHFRPALAAAAAGLMSAHQVLGPQTHALKIDNDGTVHPLETVDPCVRLKIDVGGIARRELSPFVAFPFPNAKTLAPDLLLWQPARVSNEVQRSISIQTAPGVRSSVPWARQANGRYSIDESTFRQMSVLAFGDFETVQFRFGMTAVEVAILSKMAAEVGDLELWLSEGVRAVSTATGSFPVDHLQVVILPFPSPLSEKPVAFGMAARGGGAAAFFVANKGADGHRFVGEWVAIHEMSHLLLPFVQKSDAWLSEGLATYHQNVLRARAGLLSEREGWFELVEGIVMAEEMASNDGRPMLEATSAMRSERNYRQVYWTGATLALLLDVRLRLQNGPPHGLNVALVGLEDHALKARAWTAEEVLAAIDDTSGSTVGATLLKDAASQVFPDIWPLLERLGVRWTGDDVELDDTAELVAIRRAIMAPPVPTIGNGAAARPSGRAAAPLQLLPRD